MFEKELFENMPTGIGVFDVTGNVIEMKYLNDGYYRMIHADRGTRKIYAGTNTVLAIHPDDRAGLLQEAHDSIEGRRMFQCRFRVLSGADTYSWIGIRANHTPLSSTTERFYAVYYDVNTYMDMQQKLNSILSSLPGGVAVFSDHDGKIKLDYTNDSFYELHHGSRAFWKTESDNPVDWLLPEDRHLFKDELALVRSGKKAQGNTTYCVRGQDGKAHWINNQFKPAYVQDGIQYYYSSFSSLDDLKEAEASRDKVRMMYEFAVEDTKLVVWEYDIVHKRVIMAENEHTKYDYRKFGLPKITENVPESLLPYIDEDSVKTFLDMYQAVENGEPTVSCEVWYKTAPGTEPRCEHIRYVTVFDENHRPVKAYGIGQNITAQKIEHEKYINLNKQIATALPDAVSSTRLNLSKDRYLSGYSPYTGVAERLEQSSADRHFAAAIASVPDENIRSELFGIFTCENLIRLFKAGTTQAAHEYPVKTSSGSIMWINTTVYLLQNPETGDIEAVTYAKDITKQKKDEEIIRYLSKDGCDFIGILDTVSKTFELMDGLWDCSSVTKGQVIEYIEGRNRLAHDYIVPDEQTDFLKATELETICSALKTEAQYTAAYNFLDQNKIHLKKQIRFSVLKINLSELLVVQNDITEASQKEQKHIEKLQEALVEAEKANTAKSEFVSRISHDIRTPISVISSMTAFAKEDIGNTEKLLSDLRNIESSNTFLLSLINDVLDISKIDSGKIELHPEQYLYSDYISNIRNMFDPICTKKNISFVITKTPFIDMIIVDQTRLNQITLNLLSNAVKYTLEGGTVTFSAQGYETDTGKVACSIRVKDTGIGMSKEFQETMFEPFTQEYNNPLRDKTIIGTGLGLSIVKKLINLMGGTVTVESERGKGTDICVQFTADKVISEHGESIKSGTESGKTQAKLSGTLLLAEDNILNTEIAKRILETMGFSIVHAENGEKAVEYFSSSAPGTFKAILMDIQMPVMNGYEAAEKIRSLPHPEAAAIPIIAMTADAFSAAIEHCKAVGMNNYVTKPIDPDRLKEVLQHFTATSS